MKRLAMTLTFALAVGAVACLDPEHPAAPTDFGAMTVTVTTTGRQLDNRGSDSLLVALDSAIQGFGLQQIYFNADSASFPVVLFGIHETSLRGLPQCTVVGGRDRLVLIDRQRPFAVVRYEVQC